MTLNELIDLVLVKHENVQVGDTIYGTVWFGRDDITYDAPLLTEDQDVLSARLELDAASEKSQAKYPGSNYYVEFYIDGREPRTFVSGSGFAAMNPGDASLHFISQRRDTVEHYIEQSNPALELQLIELKLENAAE